MPTNETVIEKMIQDAGATAPRLTPAHIDEQISSEFFFTAGDGVRGASEMGTSPAGKADALNRFMICVLVLRNGFVVMGESAPASPENFNAEIGRKIARDKAREKIWPLEGYALRTRLAST
jgi:hypothetical protein